MSGFLPVIIVAVILGVIITELIIRLLLKGVDMGE